jgi:hypothetical protein
MKAAAQGNLVKTDHFGKIVYRPTWRRVQAGSDSPVFSECDPESAVVVPQKKKQGVWWKTRLRMVWLCGLPPADADIGD